MKKLIFIAVIPVLLMNCAPSSSYSNGWVTGSGGNSTTIINTTTGQELLDLQEALDSGAITPEEYDELKLKIMERLNAPVDSTVKN